MRVSVLPNDDKDCGWINTLPPLDPPTVMAGDQDADWVVLGAGFTGMAAARQLASHLPDKRIVLLDAQRAGQGASGRNAGFIIDLPHHVDSTDIEDQTVNHRTRRLNHAAIDWLRELVQTHGIDCQWSERGKFHCAIEDKGIAELQKFKRGLDALDEPYTALDAEALAARIGTRYYREGVHTPGNILMQPAALARGLARWLPNSVELIENAPVAEIDYGPVVTLTTPGGKLADNVWAHVCQNGVGVAKGTIGGKLLADMIAGATSDLLTDMLAYPRPQKNPPRPFLDLAATVMVNWEQRKAGRER
jgi:glycine/D-amino acid oxidase-like deaminating enzyme